MNRLTENHSLKIVEFITQNSNSILKNNCVNILMIQNHYQKTLFGILARCIHVLICSRRPVNIVLVRKGVMDNRSRKREFCCE